MSSQNNNDTCVYNQVFKQELLLEMILDYATYGQRSSTEIQNCRLVNMRWLLSTFKILRKKYRPLYKISLNWESLVKGRPLNEFLNSMTSDSRIEPFIPPISLKLKTNFFREENYQNLVDLLQQCGSSLVELEIRIPSDGGTLPFLINNISFPNLNSLTINFDYMDMYGNYYESGSDFANNNNTVYLLQLIFDSANVLKYCNIVNNFQLLPKDFGYLRLPSSTELVHLHTQLSPNDVQIFGRNPLPNLKSLHFHSSADSLPYPDGFIFETLQRFSKSLENFQIKGDGYQDGVPVAPNYFTFPFMEKLKCVQFDRMEQELDGCVNGFLNELLPTLEKVELSCQTPQMFQKWTVSSKYENVKDLKISLVDESVRENGNFCIINADIGIMQSMNSAFPNIRKLSIMFTMTEGRRDISGMQFLYSEMNHLEELCVSVYADEQETSSDFWDSLLTGVPINRLKNVRESLSQAEFNLTNFAESPSLTRLSELKILRLHCQMSRAINPCSLISDVVFTLAFLNMPKLMTLELLGEFKASNEMMSKWTADGRTIKTQWWG